MFQFAKLARSLEIPGGMRVGNTSQGIVIPDVADLSGTASGGENTTPAAPTQLDDDELEGGLC